MADSNVNMDEPTGQGFQVGPKDSVAREGIEVLKAKIEEIEDAAVSTGDFIDVIAKTNELETALGDKADVQTVNTLTSQLAETAKNDGVVIENNPYKPLTLFDFSGYNESFHPKTIYIPGGFAGYKYWMVTTPYPVNALPYRDRWESPCVYKSNDKYNWINAENANPLDDLTSSEISRRDYMSDTHILYRKDLKRIEVWYRHTNNGTETLDTVVLRKCTTDGINWTDRETMIGYKANTSEDLHRSPAYIWDDTAKLYRAWYQSNSGVFYNTSIDGKIWGTHTKCTFIGKSPNTWHLDCEFINGEYHYLSYDKGNTETEGLYYYKSTDMINFTFVKKILGLGNGITRLYRSCFMQDELGKIYVYYTQEKDGKAGIDMLVGDNFMNLEYAKKPLKKAEKFSDKDGNLLYIDSDYIHFRGETLKDISKVVKELNGQIMFLKEEVDFLRNKDSIQPTETIIDKSLYKVSKAILSPDIAPNELHYSATSSAGAITLKNISIKQYRKYKITITGGNARFGVGTHNAEIGAVQTGSPVKLNTKIIMQTGLSEITFDNKEDTFLFIYYTNASEDPVIKLTINPAPV